MAVDVKQASRRILEDCFGKGKLEVLDEVCDRSFRTHDPLTGDADLAGFKDEIRMYRAAFPDLKPTLLGACAEGDVVCTFWRMSGTHRMPLMGVDPTGRQVTVEGMTFDRFRDGKLVESFVQWDTLRFLRSLGVLPEIRLGEESGAEQPPAH
jgi:predicted ester cyclase